MVTLVYDVYISQSIMFSICESDLNFLDTVVTSINPTIRIAFAKSYSNLMHCVLGMFCECSVDVVLVNFHECFANICRERSGKKYANVFNIFSKKNVCNAL